MISIVVGTMCMVIMIIVIYIVSRRRQRSASIIQKMQFRKSIASIAHKKENSSSIPNNKKDCDLRMTAYVHQEIIIKGTEQETDKGAGIANSDQIGNDEFIVETKGNDIECEGK